MDQLHFNAVTSAFSAAHTKKMEINIQLFSRLSCFDCRISHFIFFSSYFNIKLMSLHRISVTEIMNKIRIIVTNCWFFISMISKWRIILTSVWIAEKILLNFTVDQTWWCLWSTNYLDGRTKMTSLIKMRKKTQIIWEMVTLWFYIM